MNRVRYRYRLLILISLSVPAVQIIRANLLSDRKLQAASIGGWRPGDEGVGQLLRIFPVHRLNENAGRHAVSGRPIKEQALQLAQAYRTWPSGFGRLQQLGSHGDMCWRRIATSVPGAMFQAMGTDFWFRLIVLVLGSIPVVLVLLAMFWE